MKIENLKLKIEKSSGFTLIETIVALGIFAIIAVGVYSSYLNVLDITIASQLNSTALAVMGNELESIRNVDFQDVGTVGGAPAGILPAEKNINFSGYDFVLKTTVRNIDDPFDGVLGGSPNDSAPADYKLVELTLDCLNCTRFIPITTTTYVAPANLESTTKNGSLFINVIDASGHPVTQANVSVINNLVNPAISINDTTNNAGQLQLVDIATSSLGYQITVAKPGYSSEKTYKIGDSQNPNPIKPHSTVVSQQITLVTFGIDKLSSQNLVTRNKFCQAVSDIDFSQQGTKLIGVDPDVLKYSVISSTDSGGVKISDLEWDIYTIQNIDPAYDLAGTTPLSPITVNPGSNYAINWLIEPRNQSSFLAIVQADGGQFIDDAVVILSKTGFSETKVSGHNYFDQTDWSGGEFFQKSQNVDENNPLGDLTLAQIGGKYATNSLEWLESKTYDMGEVANFYMLRWNPQGQPLQTGTDSLKFQIATNNDNSTWNYLGPDGSPATYYTNTDSAIYTGHNGSRYLRYKVFLITEDPSFTPRLEDVEMEFSSLCIPDGQSFFSGFEAGIYTLTVHRNGYQDYTAQINIGSGWQEHRIVLTP